MIIIVIFEKIRGCFFLLGKCGFKIFVIGFRFIVGVKVVNVGRGRF